MRRNSAKEDPAGYLTLLAAQDELELLEDLLASDVEWIKAQRREIELTMWVLPTTVDS